MPSSPRTDLTHARWLSTQLDRRYIDPILGFLLPGAGDLLSSSLGLYVLYVAWQSGASRLLLARMLVNLAIDTSLGSVPIVGDVFDIFFKANERNLALLERGEQSLSTNSARDVIYLVLALVFFLAALILPIVALIVFVRWLF